MKPFRYQTATEQLTDYLREQIQRGKLAGDMPGIGRLSVTLGCSQRTVIGAIKQLEHDGLVINFGPGRASQINPKSASLRNSLRIQILLYEALEAEVSCHIKIQQHLINAGHSASYSSKTLTGLKMDPQRISKYVESVDADAWVVTAGSRDVLEWFIENSIPAFALFGRRRDLPIAGVGPNREKALSELTRHLIGLGHERIALLARPERRLPHPGLPERTFLNELNNAGIETGAFNLPGWDGTTKHLHYIVEAMFRLTPPTALIIDETSIFLSVQNQLSRKGILAPQNVSLICCEDSTHFDSIQPTIAHIKSRHEPLARSVTHWANQIAAGRNSKRQTLTKTTLFLGETLGPPPKK